MSDLVGAHPDLLRRGIYRGVDFGALAARLWKLEAMRASGPLPKIRWRAYEYGGARGMAYMTLQKITLCVGADSPIENVAELVLHELVHCACPPREHHGELFCRRLIACAREGFGLALDTAALLELRALDGRGCRAYAIGHAIKGAMKGAGVAEALRAQIPFEPPPEQSEEEIAARQAGARAARVSAREAHARAKLAEWERKTAAAKRIAAKWRTRVRYYEKKLQAAAKK